MMIELVKIISNENQKLDKNQEEMLKKLQILKKI